MTDLDRATRALRDSAVPDGKQAEETLARLERTVRARRVSRLRVKRYFVLPIAAVLLVGTAWAGASGKLREMFSAPPVVETAVVPPLPAPVKEDESGHGHEPEAQAMPVEELPSAIPSVAVKAPVAKVDPDVLYREAHEDHFVIHDYGLAIPAWDRYLAAAGPGGRFVVEARYNRGIALARVGRSAEARTALEPFANGDYGNYRREEAQKLLDTLNH